MPRACAHGGRKRAFQGGCETRETMKRAFPTPLYTSQRGARPFAGCRPPRYDSRTLVARDQRLRAAYHVPMRPPANLSQHRLRAGMVGLGMIFDDTYRPLFEQLHTEGLYRRDFGLVE